MRKSSSGCRRTIAQVMVPFRVTSHLAKTGGKIASMLIGADEPLQVSAAVVRAVRETQQVELTIRRRGPCRFRVAMGALSLFDVHAG